MDVCILQGERDRKRGCVRRRMTEDKKRAQYASILQIVSASSIAAAYCVCLLFLHPPPFNFNINVNPLFIVYVLYNMN